MKRKRLLCLLLALCLLPLLGCSGTDADDDSNQIYDELADYYKQKEQEKDPTISSFSLPYLQGLTLDPISCADGTQQDIGRLLYEGLVQLNLSMQPQPMLAEFWSYDAASYTWTIHLRSGVTFTDGSAFTASDAVAALRRAKTSPRYGSRLGQMASVRADGGQTVIIRLERPNSSFLSLLDIPIVKSGTESSLVPTGTGRYVFVPASGAEGAYLTAHTGWWQKKSLPMERIDLYTCKNSDTVSYAFYAREVQLLRCDLSDTASTGAVSSGDFTDADTTVMHFLGFNTTRPPFNSAAVRQAVSLGIDRSGCVSSFLMGHGVAANYPLCPSSALYPDRQVAPYSPDDFNTAITAAGFGADAAPVSVTLLVNSESAHKQASAAKIAAALSDSALQVSVAAVPWNEFISRLESGKFDLYYGEYKMTPDWDLTELLSGSSNYGGYNNADLAALLSAERSAPAENHAAAASALYEAFRQQMPIAPICFARSSILTTSGVIAGLTPSVTDPFYNLSDWKIRFS